MLILKNVVKFYQDNLVIEQLSYHFDKQRYCIVGPNGSGKTTLLMLAGGLESVTAGEVYYNHQAVELKETKRQLGISSDKIILPEFLTSQQLITFHCTQHDCNFPHPLITSLNFTQQLTTQVAALSLGSLKKLSLIIALAHQPNCLLLDEPTTGLDQQSRIWLLDYIDRYPGQIIITSHEACFTENEHFQQVLLAELQQANVA
ncbi:ATP-binding cassette domain-containing protein [Colwelliaceae bacterium 6441]